MTVYLTRRLSNVFLFTEVIQLQWITTTTVINNPTIRPATAINDPTCIIRVVLNAKNHVYFMNFPTQNYKEFPLYAYKLLISIESEFFITLGRNVDKINMIFLALCSTRSILKANKNATGTNVVFLMNIIVIHFVYVLTNLPFVRDITSKIGLACRLLLKLLVKNDKFIE